MFKVKVLLISDDSEAGELLTYNLKQHGLEVVFLDNDQQAIKQWQTDVYAMAIINECNGLLDSLALCASLHQEASAPILLLTYERNELYSLKAYRAGVNECVIKPIGSRLLLAKVMAWLRSNGAVPTDSLTDVAVGGLCLEINQRYLRLPGGRCVNLTNLEVRLLHLLMSHHGQAVETAVIVEYVWGYRNTDDTDLLKHVVYRLRRKIESNAAHPTYLRTKAGAGYIFTTE